ncbi:MAG TPA: ACT domain-containing protein [Acidimicrobiales bacterium]|nr:ACT domain-containing protein [Acidimicrobiales bacterium]
MTHLAVSAIGADRPGIVAAVTKVLVDRGCNLEDASMSILWGHFAMMLVVDAPEGADAGGLEEEIAAATRPFGLVVVVRAIDEAGGQTGQGEEWTVSLYGADRPGIVHRVSTALAAAGANITDLTTRVIGDPGQPVYAMFLDVIAPTGSSLDVALAAVAEDLGVSCTAQRADADIL